jgi:phosphoribosylanthranilate isomerase
MVRVKICGITNLQDAMAAIELGTDGLGFNFYKKSPRYIEPSKAKPIIEALPPLISVVGIFVDEYSPERVMTIAHAIGISSVQLHGSESPEYVKQLSGLRVIKAFLIDEKFEAERIAAYPVNAYLLDTHDPDQIGGTGRSFDWNIALSAKKHGHIILAGGLNTHNIFEAIRTVGPYGVDICSSVESQPGTKDFLKMKSLFHEINRARRELSLAATDGVKS